MNNPIKQTIKQFVVNWTQCKVLKRYFINARKNYEISKIIALRIMKTLPHRNKTLTNSLNSYSDKIISIARPL